MAQTQNAGWTEASIKEQRVGPPRVEEIGGLRFEPTAVIRAGRRYRARP
jgi:hypothetical protein